MTIEGVRLVDLSPRGDDRGSFTEVFRASWAGAPAAQLNISVSRPRVLRGLHVHAKQSDWWMFLDGRAFVALADTRRDSTGTPPQVQTFELSADEPAALVIPPGVAHGFYAHTDVTLLYAVSAEYDGSDERGFRWNDPRLGIPWPDPDPILSERDRTAGPYSPRG